MDRDHNQPGEPFRIHEPRIERYERDLMTRGEVFLSSDQQAHIESVMPAICERGGWRFFACAAASNHVHVLMGVPKHIHGNDARKWLKRWLSDALSTISDSGGRWWAKGGSARVVPDDAYFHACMAYINAQRSTPAPEPPAPTRGGSRNQAE